jgi:hypothetical protein
LRPNPFKLGFAILIWGPLLLFLESKHFKIDVYKVHPDLLDITRVATKVHVIVRRFAVLT